MLEVDRAEEPVEGVDYIHPDVEEIPTGFFDANVAAAGLSFEANPTTKLNEYIRLRDKEDKGPKLSKGEINKIAQERGFDSSGIEEGVNMAQLEQIFNRKRRLMVKEATVRRSGGGFFYTLPGTLAGAVADPMFLAMDIAAGVGSVKLASRLAKVKNPSKFLEKYRPLLDKPKTFSGHFARQATEAAVAEAPLQPLSYALSQELGDDFGAEDALMEVGMSALMGGLLGAGIGKFTDAIEGRAMSKIQRAEARTPPDVQRKKATKALDDILNEEYVDVSEYDYQGKWEASKSIEDINQKINEARIRATQSGFVEDFDMLRDLQKERDDLFMEMTGEPRPEEEIDVSVDTLDDDLGSGVEVIGIFPNGKVKRVVGAMEDGKLRTIDGQVHDRGDFEFFEGIAPVETPGVGAPPPHSKQSIFDTTEREALPKGYQNQLSEIDSNLAEVAETLEGEKKVEFDEQVNKIKENEGAMSEFYDCIKAVG